MTNRVKVAAILAILAVCASVVESATTFESKLRGSRGANGSNGRNLNPAAPAPGAAPPNPPPPPPAAGGGGAAPPASVKRPGATYRQLEAPRFRPAGQKVKEPRGVTANFLSRIAAGIRTKVAKSGKMLSLDKNSPYLWEATYTPDTLQWARDTDTGSKPGAREAPLVALELASELETAAETILGTHAAFRQVTEETATDDPIPFGAIGAIAVGCSGTLISSRLYITAGHCIVNVTSREVTPWASLAFSPGQRSATYKPYGTFQASAWWVDGDYWATSSPDPENDWAVVLLTSEVRSPSGNSPGWYGFKQDTYGAVRISGYPGETKSGNDLWTDTCTISDKWFMTSSTHTCNTEPGSSGSGVALTAAADKKMLVGVHSTGSGGGSYNWACSFEGQIFDQIKAIKKQYP